VFCEVLLVENGEVIDVICQVGTLVNKSQDVSLEVRMIKELQFVWRYPVNLVLLAVDLAYPNECHR